MFDKIFTRYDPGYLRQCPPLVVLSVGAAVTGSFDNNLAQRLNWMEFALKGIDIHVSPGHRTLTNDTNKYFQHPDIRQVVRKVTEFITQRLQNTYMSLSESNSNNQQPLRRIAHLARLSGDMANRSPLPTE